MSISQWMSLPEAARVGGWLGLEDLCWVPKGGQLGLVALCVLHSSLIMMIKKIEEALIALNYYGNWYLKMSSR